MSVASVQASSLATAVGSGGSGNLFTTNIASGDSVVMVARSNNATGTNDLSAPSGLGISSFTRAGAVFSSPEEIEAWSGTSTGGSRAMAFTCATGTSWGATANEYSGVVAVNAFASNSGTSAVAPTLSMTGYGEGEVVFIGMGQSGGSASSLGAPWTNSAIGGNLVYGWQAPSGSGTVTATWTSGAHWAAVGVLVLGQIAATAAASFAFLGAGTGVLKQPDTAAAAFAFLGAGAATVIVPSGGAAAFAFTGSGAGVIKQASTAAASFAFLGAGTGVIVQSVTAAAGFVFNASGTGLVKQSSTAAAAFAFNGSGTAIVTAIASGGAHFSFSGSGTGIGVAIGVGAAHFAFLGTSSATVVVPAAGAATFHFNAGGVPVSTIQGVLMGASVVPSISGAAVPHSISGAMTAPILRTVDT